MHSETIIEEEGSQWRSCLEVMSEAAVSGGGVQETVELSDGQPEEDTAAEEEPPGRSLDTEMIGHISSTQCCCVRL